MGKNSKENASAVSREAWEVSPQEYLTMLGVDEHTGLSTQQVAELQEKYGKNELEKEEATTIWEMLAEQFDDPLVKILLFAAVVSTGIAYSEAVGEGHALTFSKFVEPLVILLILVINAIVGVWQENSAEQSLQALKRMQADTVKCLRNGHWQNELDAVELVPGDIVEISVGDKVAADVRIVSLHTTTLCAEQAALTGESVAAMKDYEHVTSAGAASIQDKHSMLFASTTISNGRCTGVVQSTGMNTEIGKIQDQIREAAEREKESKTPLKQKLDDFSDQLQWVIGVVCVLVWVINYNNFLTFEPSGSLPFTFHYKKCIYYFQIAVALAVAAIPEGLPAVITTCLALGTRKMARRNAIVRKLPSVETLGCTTVICSDKTGTLTTNMMSVQRVLTVGSKASTLNEFEVTGSTYNPDDGEVKGLPAGLNVNIEMLCQVCSICNDSTVVYDTSEGKFRHEGAPTEAALTVLVEKIGLPGEDAARLNKGTKSARAKDPVDGALGCNEFYKNTSKAIATLEFSRDRKSMSVIVKKEDENNTLLVKGAPESVIERCAHILLSDGSVAKLTAKNKKAILSKVDEYAGLAYRCLGMAMGDELEKNVKGMDTYDGPHHPAHKQLKDPSNFAKVEQNLTFVGIVAMQDPPRDAVRTAMIDCATAGVRVMVITGDNQTTAEAICRKINVLGEHEDVTDKSFTGAEFSAFPVEKQKALLSRGSMVFSRSEPKFKQDIVRLLQSLNEVVAMTGDGVNDAPALKAADIGIAMGIAGTEVAKEASDMVLADDNFSTIVAAVEEGRSIYQNMKAFIRYLISSNIGEVVSIFLTAALGLPEGLVPVQLLWVNLVTDGPPATALGFNPADPDVMQRPPRRSDDKLINGWVFFRYMVIGLYVGFATVGVFAAWFLYPSLAGIPITHDGHTTVTWEQLTHWSHCDVETNMFLGEDVSNKFSNYAVYGGETVEVSGCNYFAQGKVKASTLSLSVLVAIEMFNALNALSEDGSLLVVHPFVNPYLLVAMAVSFGLHFVILYVPGLQSIFAICALDWNEWMLVLLFSFPVILIDECLKFVGRMMAAAELKERLKSKTD